MIVGQTYLAGGIPVVVEVQWRGRRKTDEDVAARFPLLDLKPNAPRNVLLRLPGGGTVVRGFRGLRRPPEHINLHPVPCGLCGATIPAACGEQTTPDEAQAAAERLNKTPGD
mgnify:CR=1 FL=1